MVKEERKWQVFGKVPHTNRGPGEKVGTSSRGEGPPVIC